MTTDLPAYVDEHATTLDVSPDRAFQAVSDQVDHMLRPGRYALLTRVLGTVPRAGFEIVESDPPRLLSLAGRHRFSRYVLDVRVVARGEGGSVVTAVTYADFPGPQGAAYRMLVLGSRGHVLAVRRILAGIRRAASDRE